MESELLAEQMFSLPLSGTHVYKHSSHDKNHILTATVGQAQSALKLEQ
jgi:hypothetical protein